MVTPDLELSISRNNDGTLSAGLRVEFPNRRVDLAEAVPITLSPEALRALASLPDAYAGALNGMVFPPPLREAWRQVQGFAEGAGSAMRVRLHLRGDDALHTIRWELLRDPITQTPLAYREQVAFSRFLSSAELRDVQATSKPNLRAVVAVSPAAGPHMAAVDVAAEVQRAQAGLDSIAATVLDGRAGRPAATLPNIAAALRDGADMLYLVCHGTLVEHVPYLYLADDAPTQPTPGSEVVRQIGDLTQRPLLVVLASCRSGGDEYTTLAAIGPQLAQAGIGAVLAMQGDVPMEVVAALMPALFTELQRDGQIDRALAAARATLPTDAPWWIPTLWMALKDGALWRQAAAPATQPTAAAAFQVPYPQNPLFRGRDAALQQAADVLLGEAHATLAITGMGGMGKTQLASEFAHRFRDAFPGGIFWLTMAEPEAVAAQVAAMGGPGGLDLPDWSDLDFTAQLAAVRQAWQEPVRRLLIFDNLEDPDLLQDWRPSSGGTRVLLTTRRGAWVRSSGVQSLALAPLTRAESLHLLLTPRYGDQVAHVLAAPADAAAADAICEQVGDLPLALALAGTYLEQTPSLSLAGYRERLAGSLLAHPSLDAEIEEDLPTQHTESIAATIALSYQQLSGDTPQDAWALAVLQRLAQLAPTPIPHRLIVRAAERDPDDEGQVAEVDAPLHRLATVGLLDRAPNGDVTLYRLIAAFVRDQDAAQANSAAQAARAVIDEVAAINQSGYPLRGKPYLPHLIGFAQQAERLAAEQRVVLLSNLGFLLKAQGDLADARPYYEQALAIREQTVGPNHPHTATSLNNLGSILHDQGDQAGARTYYERALAIREQTLGPTHPDTAVSLNNLGFLLKAQGDPDGARAYYERALAIREQALGPTHPDTAVSLNNLGSLLHAQGDLAGARPYYERALAIREQTLGPTHPHTATSLNNLGGLLQAQGDPAGARPYYERALAIREQALGPTHPDTALSLNNLGLLLRNVGDPDGARAYYERALAICEQALGPTHPHTATSLNNLGSLLHDQGDLAGARAYYERVLAIREQTLGPTHPNTALSLNNLGTLLYDQGDPAGARAHFERALAIREQALGPTHPDTAVSLDNLGFLLKAQGELAEARPYYERALAIREQVWGPTHPNTATSLNNLGSLLYAQGDLAGARSCTERVLAIAEQVSGPTHLDTATSLNNLAFLLRAQGDLAGARAYYERVLAIAEQVLGPIHLDTATTLNNLGSLLHEQGDLAGARAYYERLLAIAEQVLGPTHLDTATTLNNLALLLHKQGDRAGARAYYERVLAICTACFGADHANTRAVQASLAALDSPQSAPGA